MVDRLDIGNEPSTLRIFVFLLWGPIIWGVQLTVVYVGHTWLCALGAGTNASDVLVGAVTFACLVLIVPVLLWPAAVGRRTRLDAAKHDSRHLIRMARALAVLSAIAVLWTGMTFLLVQACLLAR